MRSIRDDIRDAQLLAQAKGPSRPRRHQGKYVRLVSTAQQVFYCPGCNAPVVNSSSGRRAHSRRSPQCKNVQNVQKKLQKKGEKG